MNFMTVCCTNLYCFRCIYYKQALLWLPDINHNDVAGGKVTSCCHHSKINISHLNTLQLLHIFIIIPDR